MESKIRQSFMSEDGQQLILQRSREEIELGPGGNHEVTWLYLDLETTGLDHNREKIIEIGAVLFRLNLDNGKISEILEEYNAFQDPGKPIPSEITRLTGIDDSMVAGQEMDREKVASLLNQAELVLSHNAAFDRAFLDPEFPQSKDSVWACSMIQVPWRALGFPCKGLSHLCMEHGFFYDGHRALHDVKAALQLLTMDNDGLTYLQRIASESALKTFLVEAVGSPFESKDLLKARQFRWNPAKRVWWKEVAEPDLEELNVFLESEVYNGKNKAQVEEIPASRRFQP